MGTAPGDRPREEADPPAGKDAGIGGLVREAGPPQPYGPLVVRRYVKADGRGLILFERAPAAGSGS